ncbi:MAG: LytR C-terminal domain-containing protein [Candidatus Curtissbacteria bacterium]|nr:LytR C-terminal domain-containing protein [Candidatus Curtissbacteria bacterium]
MDDQQQSPMMAGNPGPIYQESTGGKNAKWLWLLIALIIVGALVFAFARGIGPFGQFKKGSTLVEESPAPESVVASPMPEATSGANIDKAAVRIRILNGSGKAGVASAAKDYIEGKGYKVTSLGNADNYDFAQTVVKIKDSLSNIKNVLVSDLSDKYSVTVSSIPLEASDSADVEVTLGAK